MHLFFSFLSLSVGCGVLAGETLDITPLKYTSTTKHMCALDSLLPASGLQHDGTCSGNHSRSLRSSRPNAEKDPWTRKPECHQNSHDGVSLCVFTDLRFNQGRGISILTDPSTAEMMSTLPAFGEHAKAYARAESPPYVVRALPGRGMGVIANRTIERGDQIMTYTATTIINGAAIGGPSGHEYLKLLHQAVDHLPSHSKTTWLDLAAHFEKDDIYIEKINTNGFSEDFNEQEHYVVIPEIARMNHDCRPNAMYYFDRETLTQNVHATRTIYAGEEITITCEKPLLIFQINLLTRSVFSFQDIDPLQTFKKRRAATKLSWGFDCSCSLCTQSTSLKHASDKRIETIVEVAAALTASSHTSQASPEMAELLISLYDQERLYVSVADAYVLAARAFKAVGKELMAVKYAMKAVELGIIHSGPKDVDVKEMWELINQPREFAKFLV